MVRSYACLVALSCATLAHASSPADGVNRFAVKCYQQLTRSGDNLIYSPFSISAALSMTLAGARGQTATEIAAVLSHKYPDPAYHATFAALADQLANSGNNAGDELLNASALWVDRDFRIQSEFEHLMANVYHAPLTSVTFSSNPEEARRQINEWTGRQTRSHIPELFTPGSLSGSTRLVLSSATWFHGKWKFAFRPAETRRAEFHTSGTRTIQARFMNQTGRFGYARAAAIQILELPYAGGAMAFDVLLPDSIEGLQAVEESLDPAVLTRWLAGVQTRDVEVALPKFRADSDFSLREALSRLGMPGAFGSTADFSGIDDRRDLALSEVKHKAFVEVTEEGTKAAAATGSVVNLISMQVSQRPVFRADHPFVYLIRDTRTGTILFAGRLCNPSSI